MYLLVDTTNQSIHLYSFFLFLDIVAKNTLVGTDEYPLVMYETRGCVENGGEKVSFANLAIAHLKPGTEMYWVDVDVIFEADKLLAVRRKLFETKPTVYYDPTGLKLQMPAVSLVVRGRMNAIENHLQSSELFREITLGRRPREFANLRKYLMG